jgi:hypothetical protein
MPSSPPRVGAHSAAGKYNANHGDTAERKVKGDLVNATPIEAKHTVRALSCVGNDAAGCRHCKSHTDVSKLVRPTMLDRATSTSGPVFVRSHHRVAARHYGGDRRGRKPCQRLSWGRDR